MRQAIEDRLSDSSPSVRDAAVELVGKYVVQKPKLAAEYYPHLALRVAVCSCRSGWYGVLIETRIRGWRCENESSSSSGGFSQLPMITIYGLIYAAK